LKVNLRVNYPDTMEPALNNEWQLFVFFYYIKTEQHSDNNKVNILHVTFSGALIIQQLLQFLLCIGDCSFQFVN